MSFLLTAYAGCFVLISVIPIERFLILFLFVYSVVFVLYAALCYLLLQRDVSAQLVYAVVLCVGVSLLLAVPTLSSDVFRYLWDGSLLVHGVNPYLYLPTQIADSIKDTFLYAHLGWKDQYTVYPPIAQGIFVAAYLAYVAFGLAAAKCVFVLPWIGSMLLLRRLLPSRYLLLFILNPLALFEIYYGAHIDAWVLFFVLLSWWGFEQKKYVFSPLMLALATATKVYPLVLMPFFIVELYRQRKFKALASWGSIYITGTALFFTPLFFHAHFFVVRFGSWVHDMQYNASMYTLVHLALSYSHVLPVSYTARIDMLLLALCLGLLLIKNRLSVYTLTLAVFFFFLFSSVVYPWYTLIFVPLVFLYLKDVPSVHRAVQVLIFFTLMQWLISLTYISEFWTVPEQLRVQLYGTTVVVEYVVLLVICVYCTATFWNNVDQKSTSF